MYTFACALICTLCNIFIIIIIILSHNKKLQNNNSTKYPIKPLARRDAVIKKLSYRRGTARCVVSIEILPIAPQQGRNYLYDKS